MKIAILSSFTVKNILPQLKEVVSSLGFSATFYEGNYNQYVQEILDKQSSYWKFSADITFIFIDPESIFGDDIYNSVFLDENTTGKLVYSKICMFKSLMNSISDSNIVISNLYRFAETPLYYFGRASPQGPVALIDKFNFELRSLLASKSHAFLLDIHHLSSVFGIRNITDSRLKYLGSINFTNDFCKVVSAECGRIIRAMYGISKKCLIVDLDNTLWGGVVGEDGPEGISIGTVFPGNVFLDVQKYLKSLKQRGILLAVCSKNNMDDVEKAFTTSGMVLSLSDFVSIRANWDPKTDNIASIASELNIKTDSIVFLDDSPHERALVKEFMPEVEVVDFPENIEELPATLYSLHFFETKAITEEDKKKTVLYHHERERDKDKKQFNSVEDFLKNLNIQICIEPISDKNIKRAFQLVNKTNQFNLRTIRYTEDELTKIVNSPKYCSFTLFVRDKFGDYGQTGIAIFKDEGNNYFLENYLLSCRILSKKIEFAFLSRCIELLPKHIPLRGEFIQTPKNVPSINFLTEFGLEKNAEGIMIINDPLTCGKEIPFIGGYDR